MRKSDNGSKKTVSAVAMAGVMALGLAPVWAQQTGSSEQQQQQRSRQEQSQQSQRFGELISADRLKNSRVVDQQNREVGEISNIFIDPQSGRIARADIDFNGGILGTGETYSVSWDQLSIKRQGNEMTVAVDQSVMRRVEQASDRGDRRTAQQREQRQAGSERSQQRLSADQMSREQIRQVQLHLNKEGFNAGSVDGKWNSQTQNAIRNFQEHKGIQATGELDERTLDELGLDADEFREQKQSQRRSASGQSSR